MFKILLGLLLIGSLSALRFERRRGNSGNSGNSGKEDFGTWTPYSDNNKGDESVMESKGIDDDSLSSVVSAAIKTQRYHRIIPVHDDDEDIATKVIKIEPYQQPIKILYKTESNPVSVEQMHTPSKAEHEETSSEDEPHRVTHKVFRPVIQEIKEIIQPYRRIKQEVRPVIEEVHTVVARRDRKEREQKKKTEEESQSNDSGKEYKKMVISSASEEESASDDDKNNSWKVKYQSDIEALTQKAKENRKYSRSRQESADEEEEEIKKKIEEDVKKKSEDESNKKKAEEDNEESAKRPQRPKMRTPILPPLYTLSMEDEANDDKSWKPIYQSESESSNRKSKESKRPVRYTDDITTVLEKMTNLMGSSNSDHYKMRASQPSMIRANPPLLNLNSGKIVLMRRDGKRIYAGNMQLNDDFFRAY